MKNGIEKIQNDIWKNPIEDNWKQMIIALKKNSAKYYKVIYSHKSLRKFDDLTESFVEIYNGKLDKIAKLPLFKKGKKQILGSLEFLKWLKQKS